MSTGPAAGAHGAPVHGAAAQLTVVPALAQLCTLSLARHVAHLHDVGFIEDHLLVGPWWRSVRHVTGRHFTHEMMVHDACR